MFVDANRVEDLTPIAREALNEAATYFGVSDQEVFVFIRIGLQASQNEREGIPDGFNKVISF